MSLPSAIAIYFLFWWLSALLVLPFINARNQRGEGDSRILGQADSAPARFPVGTAAVWITLVATILFALFWLNWEFGWITLQMLDWTQW